MSKSKTAISTSNLRIMLALFAKDWRLFRAPMVALLVVGAGCYAIAITANFHRHTTSELPDSLSDWAVGGCDLTAVLAAAFGRIAIAGERADRTGDFLGLLPITRTQIVFSKWMISLLMLGACASFHLLIARWFASPLHSAHGREAEIRETGSIIWIGCTASFFGIAWLLSTFTRSGPISACVAIAVTIAIFFQADLQRRFPSHDWAIIRSLAFPPLAIGLASLVAGTLYYLRRVAP